jgi:hypothetical protein
MSEQDQMLLAELAKSGHDLARVCVKLEEQDESAFEAIRCLEQASLLLEARIKRLEERLRMED